MKTFWIILSLFSLVNCSTTTAVPIVEQNPCMETKPVEVLDCKNISVYDKAKQEACYQQSIKDSPCLHKELEDSHRNLREERIKAEEALKPNAGTR